MKMNKKNPYSLLALHILGRHIPLAALEDSIGG